MFINKISPSRSDIIDQCLLKYKYKYILGIKLKSPNEDDLNFGSYVHKVFERGKDSKHIKEIQKIAEDVRPNYHISSNLNEKIKICIENFIRLNNKLGPPNEVELEFNIEIAPGISANGIIDRINFGKDGGVLVIDYKSSKKEKTKKDLINDNQARTYVYAAHKLFNIPINKITFAHFYPLTNNLVPVKIPESLVESWRKEAINKVWKIRKKTKDEFPPMENKFCNWCEYQCMCPKFETQDKVDKVLNEQLELKKKEDSSPDQT